VSRSGVPFEGESAWLIVRNWFDDVTFERGAEIGVSHSAMPERKFQLVPPDGVEDHEICRRNTTLATSDISDRSGYIIDAGESPNP